MSNSLQDQLKLLQDQLKAKLFEQRDLSDRLRAMLVGGKDKLGLIENSRLTNKNLDAAITASKQPGYFAYYEAPESIKQMVRNKEVSAMQRQIARSERELGQLELELAKVRKSIKQRAGERSEPTMNSLAQWFASGTTSYVGGHAINVYGKPERPPVDGWLTEFVPDKKVYGGTKHHNAFRTMASKCQRGRMTK